MAFETPTETYKGSIGEVDIGKDSSKVTVGGETALNFHLWEGKMPNQPKIAMEVYDEVSSNWPEAAIDPFKEVINDPSSWALKCEQEHKADMICLQLASTDPNGSNTSPEDAANTVEKILEAISIPLIIYGSGNIEKDEKVLKKVSEKTHNLNLLVGPAQEDNYRSIAAAALGYGHNVTALSPVDINIAKQLNILLTQLGVAPGKLVIDPTTGALGYGLEYSYSIIERLRLAALLQKDEMTQMPIICNLGKEVWKTKEARVTSEEEPSWGDPKTRAILWEAITATTLLLAGADILVMRHPDAVELVREIIKDLMDD